MAEEAQAVTPDRAASDSCRGSPTVPQPVRPGFVPGRNHSGGTGRLRRFATALLIALAAVASGMPAFAQSPVQTAGTLVLSLDTIARDDTVNIAEKLAGFAVAGKVTVAGAGTEVADAAVTVTVGGTELTAQSGADGQWSVGLAGAADYLVEPDVLVSVTASKANHTDAVAVTRTLGVDLTAPSASGAPTVDGAVLTWTFDEALDAASVPPADRFAVLVAGAAAEFASDDPVAVEGTTVTLTLESLVRPARAMTLRYTAPSGRGALADAAGNPVASDTGPRTVTIETPPTTPDAVASFAATGGNRAVVLTWTAPAETGGAEIEKFQYRLSSNEGTTWRPNWTDVPDGDDAGNDAGNEATFTVRGLAPGRLYRIELRAVNSAGAGVVLWAPATTTVSSLPVIPSPGDGSTRLVYSVSPDTRTWEAYFGGTPDAQLFTTGPNSTGYRLSGIELSWRHSPDRHGTRSVSARICSVMRNPRPSYIQGLDPADVMDPTGCWHLTAPSNQFQEGTTGSSENGRPLVFKAPDNLILDPATRYAFVLNITPASAKLGGANTAEAGEPGWRIANNSQTFSSYSSTWIYPHPATQRLRMVIRGFVRPSDVIPPTVVAIERRDPATSPTGADSLTWRVTFSENVVKVDRTDFEVTGTSAGLSVSRVTGSVYDVTATGGDLAQFNGTVVLSLAENHNIEDGGKNALVIALPTEANQNSYAVHNASDSVQMDTVLVSNHGQGFAGPISFSETKLAAQGFRTGDNPGGYGLSQIRVRRYFICDTSAIASLHKADGNGRPGAKVADLEDESTSASAWRLVPTSPQSLTPRTDYVVQFRGADALFCNVETTVVDDEDATPASGWSIHNNAFVRRSGVWQEESRAALRLAVDGTLIPIPTAADSEVTSTRNTIYTFAAADFTYADPVGSTLSSVKIISLPDTGVLKHGGTQILPAALPKTVTMADLDGANQLTYTPPAGQSGNNLATFTFKVNNGQVDSTDTYTMTIDVVTAAALAAVEVTSVPTRWSDGSGSSASVRDTYGAGERIEFIATFDSGVTVTGEPHLVFTVGETRKNAAYDASLSAAAGHGKMVFTYRVRPNDRDNDGIGLLDSSDSGLENGAIVLGDDESITSGNGAGAASLILAGFKGTQSGHRVEGSRSGPHPVSLEVTSTPRASDMYRKGDVIELTLTMGEAVTVTGTPHLVFEVGSFDRDAAYDSAKSTSTELVFAYTIASGEEDDDGIFVKDGRDFTDTSSSVVLEAGETVQDQARRFVVDADLVHPGRGRRSGHKVDAVAPTVDSFAIRGTSLEIAFAEELGAAASLTNAPFTVKKTPEGGSPEDITLTGTPAIGGRTVTLTLAASPELGSAVTVRYDKPDTGSDNKLVDAIGNEVDDFEQTIEKVPNVPAEGRPEVSGTKEAGQTLTAAFGTVTDTDGVPDAADLAWQWFRRDGATDTEIVDASSTSYTLTADDAYKRVSVRVSFTDARGSPEARRSLISQPIIGDCSAPDLAGRRQVWQGELRAVLFRGDEFGYRRDTHDVHGNLAGDTVSLTRSYRITLLSEDGPQGRSRLRLGIPHHRPLTGPEQRALQLHICDRTYAFSAATTNILTAGGEDHRTYNWPDASLRWRARLMRTARLSLPANNEATGAPAIVVPHALRVPATLSVDLSGIRDADGGDVAKSTTYNWQRVDAADGTVVADGIGTGPTYNLASSDVGSRIRVEVSFTDALGTIEGPLASEAVPAAGTVMTATPCAAPTYVGGATQIGAARTLTVSLETLGGTDWYGFSGDAGGLLGAGFAVGSNSYEIRHARVSASGTLSVKLDKNLTAADRSLLGLHVCGTAFIFASAAGPSGDHAYTWSASSLDWSGHIERTLYLSGDYVAPHVVSIERRTPASSPTNADTLTWRVSFNEAVTGVDAADFEVSGTDAALSVAVALDSPTAWDVTASGGDLADLSATVELAFASSQTITDNAGNGLANTRPTNTNENSYAMDNTAPSLIEDGAVVAGTRLVLFFDENLVDTASVTNARFAATKTPPGGSAAEVALTGTPAIRGSTVTLTLGAAPAATDRVTVIYRKPDSGTGNRLIDKAGNEVDPFETSTTGGADAPRSLAAALGDTRVRLVWEAPADDGGGAITGYEYRHAAGSTVPETTAWTDVPYRESTTVLIEGLANGTTSAFEVRALNSAGAGAAARTTATLAAISCTTPVLGTRREVWSETLTVGLESTFVSSAGVLDVGYSLRSFTGSGSVGVLPDRGFSIGADNYMINELLLRVGQSGDREGLVLQIAPAALEPFVIAKLRIHACDETVNLADAASIPFAASVTYQWNQWNRDSLDWSLYRTLEVALSLPANNDASGKPAITGTPGVGETLIAALGTVSDADGIPNARTSDFAWQWVRVDADGASNPTDIENATASRYTLTAEDLGKRIKVRASFTDLLGSNETPESAAYPAGGVIDNASGPAVIIAAGDDVETEGESAEFTLSLSEPAPEGGLSVAVTVEEVERRDRSAGGADEGELPYDFVAADEEGANAVSFAVGATSATLTVPTVADSLYEAGAGAANLLRATVTAGSGYRLGATTAAELKLGEGGEEPVVSFRDAAEGLTVEEDAGEVEVVAELTEAYVHRVPLHVAFTASSASVKDFDDPGAGGSMPTYWFAPGISEISITVQITDDLMLEDTEDFSLRIVESSTPTISEDADEITISITDDDEAQLDISASDILGTATGEVIEGGNIEIHVGPARPGATGDCDIPFEWYAEIAPAGDTAALGDAASQRVRIIACKTGTATFATVDDAAVTADRSVRFSIARVGLDAAFATTDERLLLPASNEVTLTVREDEATGAPAISAPGVFRVPAVLSVDLSGIMDADGVADIADSAAYKWQRLSADGATVEADSIGTSATYTLAAADVGRKLRVQVNFTDDAENAEGPLASAAVPSGADTVEAGLTVGFGEHQGHLREGDSVDVPVVLSGSPGREITIELTAGKTHGLSDSDVTTSSLSLTFGSQDTRRTVTVTAVDDSVADPGEVLVLNLPAAADLPPEITATDTDTSVRIVDNDFDYRVSHAGGTALDVAEGAGTLTATVRVDTPESVDSGDLTELDETVTLSASTQDGTATAGEDYTAVTGLTLTFGVADFVDTASCSCLRAEKTVSISITDDTVNEDDPAETFTLALSHESDQRADYGEAGATATVSITDDDAAGTLALSLDTIAGDDTVNIAEKAAGFAISGDTGSEAGVSVTVAIGTESLSATSADASGTAKWSVSVPADGSYITGTSVDVSVTASKTDYTSPGAVERTLAIDLTAPTVTTTGVPETSTAAYTATFTFSEAVTGFAVGDIAVGNGTASAFTGSGGDTVYTALVTPSADGTVTVDVAVDAALDAAGNGNAAAARASSTYTAPNTAPTASDGTVTTAEDTAYEFGASDFNFADTDSGDVLERVKIVTLPAAGSLTLSGAAVSADGTVTRAQLDNGDLEYAPAANEYGEDIASFTFKVSDGTAESAATYTMTIDVDAVNDAPTGAPAIVGEPRAGVTLMLDLKGIVDADGLPSADGFEITWFHVGSQSPLATGTTYELTQSDIGEALRVTVEYEDDGGEEEEVVLQRWPASGTIAANRSPVVANAIPDQTSTAGTSFSYAFPENTFSDPDTDDTLSYEAAVSDGTELPSWLSFTAGTRTFSGTPAAGDVGTVSVKVTARDGNGDTAADIFDIVVRAALAAPTYTAPATLKVGAAITAMSPTGGAGIDEYDATGLPEGLSIDDGTGVISGTPAAAATGTATATVTVSDTEANTATVDITFPAVAKGDQTLSGFGYSESSVTLGSAAPTLTAPGGAQGALSYAASPSDVCTVDAATGALTLAGAGSCTVTVTAAGTADYEEATATATVTVNPVGALTLNVGTIAGDDTINIAEKELGFVISGDTGSEAGVSVTVQVGTATLSGTSADDNGTATWSVSVPADAVYITGASVVVGVSAAKTGFTAPADVERALAIDLTAPTAPTYTAPGSLKVGVAIAAMSPAGVSGIDAYSATGLPTGLSIDAGTGVISGTPAAAATGTATATVTVSDTAGNSATVEIVFPAVAKGDQTLIGFGYSDASVRFGSAAPTVTAPTGVETTLSYAASPTDVCMVDASTGALTLVGVGICTVTATAAGTADYEEATDTDTVTVQAAGTLALNVGTIAGDDTINIAEKAEGFAIGGNTGSEVGVSVTVQVGTATLSATSADDNGTATWSVNVPADAVYITGASVVVGVSAAKTGFTAPADVERALAIDLTAPTAPSYTAPATLKVGAAIAAMSPAGVSGIDAYSATGLPTGLSIDAGTGVIGGTPAAADTGTATATVTVSDTAGNSDTVEIAFPAVAKGDQTLSGFGYSESSVTLGSAAPTLTAPGGAQGALSYAASPTDVCMVDASTGALTLVGVGICTVTATAAGTADYEEATDTDTVTVNPVGALTLNVGTISGDDTINIAEKAEGFAIGGNTGSEAGVSVTVQVGTATLSGTSADDNGTATWSVSVPADAVYITGASVVVGVSAAKTGFSAPADVERALAIDLTAPVAPTYTAPATLKVGAAIAAMSPAGVSDIDAYSATGLPTGLSIDAGTGVIGGTPAAADTGTATATVTVSDTAGNTAMVDITFPAVAKGDQTLSGFSYNPSSVTFGSAAPTLTAPGGAQGALSYAASPTAVCTVNAGTGALTLVGVGSCEVTVTAAGTADYNEATDTDTVTVQAAGTLALNVGTISGDDTINIAEKAEGFAIGGNTGSEAGVSVTVQVGTATLSATSADDNGTATWSVSVPADAVYITGASVVVGVSAAKTGFSAPADVERALAIDLTAPVAPTYTAPATLKVGAAIAAMSPAGVSDIDAYSATGLPTGLSIDAGTGVIGGTPAAAATGTATATVTVSDTAGNSAPVEIAFPAVAKGDQTLSGFSYSPSSVTFGSAAPTLTAPGGAQGALSYAASPTAVCTVNAGTGALTLVGVGSCEVTVTAAGTADYEEATDTDTVTVQAAGTLALNVGTISGDDTINIAEKAEGFAIGGNTGSEAGVSVTVQVGPATLSATSADDNGTATWSVSVPADAVYITGASVVVRVSAAKTGFTAPADVQRAVAIDLTAPAAPTYTAPVSLKVGAAIAAMSPAGVSGIDAYSATGLPTGLSIDAGTGVIGGTPAAADTGTATATVTVSDTADNTAMVDITFPAVAKGDQTLSGFSYSPSSVTFGSAAPTLTAPGGAQGALSYAASPTAVCTVNAGTGALTLVGVGSCEVTVTAAGTADYEEATDTDTVTVQAAGTLALNVGTISGDDTINIAEKAEGFAIGGNTGSEAGVSVTVQVGTATLSATSADDNGTATWSVSVPADAVYITGASVVVGVSAAKTGFSAPADVERALAIDLTAPVAPTYTAPATLKVGAAIAAMSPAGVSDIDAYSATGLPTGLSIDAGTGVIGGTPAAAATGTATATVTVSDTAGNSATVEIAFPAVAKGDQTLSGFSYSPSSVTFGSAAPTLTAPGGAQGALSYAASPTAVCTVNASTGALTLVGVGSLHGHRHGSRHGRLRGGHRHRHGDGGCCRRTDAERGHDLRGRHHQHRGEGGGVRDRREHGVGGRGLGHGAGRHGHVERDLGRRQRHGDLVGECAGGRGVHHRRERGGEGVGGQDRVHRAGRRAARAGHRPDGADGADVHGAGFAEGGRGDHGDEPDGGQRRQ